MTLKLRSQSMPRPAAHEPSEEGQALVRLVREALGRGGAPAAAVVLREGQTELIYLAPLGEQRLSVGRFLAGLTQSRLDDGEPAQAVGLIGRFGLQQPSGVSIVQVFMEWPDCSWWHWRALVDGEGAIREETATERCAQLGDALPQGLGRWWSAARRGRLQLALHRSAPPPVMVH